MKYAVYVEGQSELLFVADVLQKYFDYDSNKCGFCCINLIADDFKKIPYPKLGDEQSENYYQIVNVNNDNRVVSKLKKDIAGLIASGFDVIIGLKDVYGVGYTETSVLRTKIEDMHTTQTMSISIPQGCDCRLHFAVMEYEAWMLALIENFVKSKGLDVVTLAQGLNIDMECDFETEIYHPFPLVQRIYNKCGESYHKHGKESFSFLSTLTMDDYEKLRHSGRCASFAKFIDSLIDGICPNLP